jgi:hypothetical protein
MASITLGDFNTLENAEEHKKQAKKRLIYVLNYNKIKVNPSNFKFKITRNKSPNWLDEPLDYPYNLSVETPDNKYNWIFLS